jgi:hypothetical protein
MRTWLPPALAALIVGQFAVLAAAVASPETSARVARLDRAFRDVSITTFEAMVEGMWEKYLIRGKGITLDENARLVVKTDRCKNQSIVGLRSERDNPVFTTFPCEGATWKPSEAKYMLANIKLPTIVVTEKNGPQRRGPYSAEWFQIEFVYIGENGFAVLGTAIECPHRQACEAMAEDLRALVKTVQMFSNAITSISGEYRGLVFQTSDGSATLVAKTELIDANFERLRTRQQVCVRKQGQDCDGSHLWLERTAVADITKLASFVTIDDSQVVSEDRTIGIVAVRCAEAGCWKTRIGGDGGKITTGLQSEQIHCKIGAGCEQMKKDLELLIALATASEHARPSRDEAESEKAAKVDNGSTKLPQLPACCVSTPGDKPRADNVAPDGVLPPANILAMAQLEQDGTVNISYTEPGPGHREVTLRYPPDHPKYNEVKDVCVESSLLQPFLCVLLNKR